MAALFQFGFSIPVLRMSEEATAKAFYVNFLSFKIEWEHRFEDSPKSPLHMQIRLGQAVIHLKAMQRQTLRLQKCEYRFAVCRRSATIFDPLSPSFPSQAW